MLIQTSSALAEFCAQLRGVPYITVDTEFMREKSYYAHLCLIQVGHGDLAAAIDPLADLDMAPLRDLLCDPNILKVFHAATQDLEIFLQKIGQVPAPVFDTQIAATVCGLGEQPGYAKLVASIVGVQIDKSSQATDWSLRPLRPRQLDYALGDVTHLCVVYETLVKRLEESGRTAWVAAEMKALTNPDRYRTDPATAYKRIRVRRPQRKTLAVLQALAEWRELAAQDRNIPRGWVARDEALVEIAQNPPKNAADLARVRSLKSHVAHGDDGKAMLEAVKTALASPESSWPELPGARPTPADDVLVALLNALLLHRCKAHDVAPSVVASRKDLQRIAGGNEDVAALRGWRREIFGADALELCAGRLALSAADGAVVVQPA